MGILKVKLQNAKSLEARGGSSGNIYCQLMVGSEKAKSKRKKTHNPAWDETFCFTRVNPSSDQLMVQVFDRIRLGKTENIGWATFPLIELNKGVEKSVSVALQGAKSGTLSLSLTGVDFGFEEGSRGRSTGTAFHDPAASSQSIISSIQSEGGNEWYLKPDIVEVNEDSQLGKGAFGVVYKGTIYGKAVAIKKLNKQDYNQEALDEFIKEVKVMCRIRHPNVVLFMGACTDPGHLAIVTELLPKGSLEALLKNNTLSMFQKFAMAKDVALALNWLHCSQGLLHLDLKPANLLVDENWNVKLADFGLSSLKNNVQSGQMVGTPWFMAPEILLQKQYDEKADVYSFGIVMWQMYTNELQPYGDRIKTLNQLIETVAHKSERPHIPEGCPKELVDTIKACWNGNPNQRPSFQDLINTSAIDNIVLSKVFGSDQSLGRECWCRLCLEKVKQSVPWEEFLKAFQQTINVPTITDIQKECLKRLLRNDADEVTCEKFSQILDWIGPLTVGPGLLTTAESLLSRADFFGPISGRQAEQNLKNQPPGTYLLRFSVTQSGDYAITAVDDNKTINHYKIQKMNGKYVVGDAKYDNLERALKEPPPPLHKVMIRPCPGSPYRDLFMQDYSEIIYASFTK